MASNITSVYGGRATITFDEHKHRYTVTVPGVVRGIPQPSVTGAINKLDKSAALVNWSVDEMANRIKELVGEGSQLIDRETLYAIVDAAKNTWRKKKQDSADIGSLVHRALEALLLSRSGLAQPPVLPLRADVLLAPNLTPDMVEKANLSVQAGIKFLDKHRIEVLQAEAPRWSPTYGFIGTGDLIARVDGKLSVLDWKTGKRCYPTVKMQLSAYKVAFEEEFPDKHIEQRVGVNITREGDLQPKFWNNDTHETDFKTFLGLLDALRWEMQNQSDERYNKPAPQVLGPLHLALEASTTN